MHNKITGNKGENIARVFLVKNGFLIIDRNYLKKWGEIDIVAKKDNVLHFFEVKTVVISVLYNHKDHKPEDNVHGLKKKRLRRVIETYLDEKGGGLDAEFQFHVICVYMNNSTRQASVKWLKNVIL